MRWIMTTVVGVALVLASAPAWAQPAPDCPEDVGAAIAASCPCDADGQGGQWKNHGKYVSCVVRFRNGLRKMGCLDRSTQREIARCAARSTCGKEGAVLCCVYDTSGTCNDALPGDAAAAGFCTDGTTPCDTDADCITVGDPIVKRRPETCTDHGGTIVGGGSVCSDCPLPPPAP